MKTHTFFIEPLDVLFLRGNTLFGHAGSYGESAVPPKPSVLAGALRSALLAARGYNLAAFARGEVPDPEIGTPDAPGSFVLTGSGLARRERGGKQQVEPLFAMPADLILDRTRSKGYVSRLQPTALHCKLGSSNPMPFVAVHAQAKREKADSGKWLTVSGWKNYLAGEPVHSSDTVASTCLWKTETRIGIGLDAAKRRAADGQLFSSEAIAFLKSDESEIGFFATARGIETANAMMLRLGGDGRAAIAHQVPLTLPEPGYGAMAKSRRLRMVLTSPGLFAGGWRPTGTDISGAFNLHGVRGRLKCAAVARPEVISGFDLAKSCPKPAQRVAPTGSVYWLDDVDATPEALHKLVEAGLWSKEVENPARRAEGFNRIALAAY